MVILEATQPSYVSQCTIKLKGAILSSEQQITDPWRETCAPAYSKYGKDGGSGRCIVQSELGRISASIQAYTQHRHAHHNEQKPAYGEK